MAGYLGAGTGRSESSIRSGRLWILNSLGMEMIANAALSLAPHERARLTSDDGRLYDVDELLGKLDAGLMYRQ